MWWALCSPQYGGAEWGTDPPSLPDQPGRKEEGNKRDGCEEIRGLYSPDFVLARRPERREHEGERAGQGLEDYPCVLLTLLTRVILCQVRFLEHSGTAPPPSPSEARSATNSSPPARAAPTRVDTQPDKAACGGVFVAGERRLEWGAKGVGSAGLHLSAMLRPFAVSVTHQQRRRPWRPTRSATKIGTKNHSIGDQY